MADVKDLTIIGGGPAGLTAALYAARARLSTLVLEQGLPGGQMATTDEVANYPGFPDAVSGAELSDLMRRQAEEFGAELELSEVERVAQEGDEFVLATTGGERRSRTVIIASGATHRKLGVPGEDHLQGRGVSYCATCDGAFFRDQHVFVVGGGDTAVQEGTFLTRFASRVTVIHRRDQLRATKVLQEKAFANPKVDFVWDSVVEEVLGDQVVNGVRVRNVKTGETRALPGEGVFVFVGILPNTTFLHGFVDLDASGYVVTDAELRTSRPGVFAAGDVRATPLRQVATAVGDGAMAAVLAEHWLEERS
ncbi:MAG: thioredoxin-disulfide reductase [Thermaerobacter sp.]|jgi:thioredoxin reductase (NADPH)|nr:thioredoxin-disulfide reductase [Thermaerobacter sp.]